MLDPICKELLNSLRSDGRINLKEIAEKLKVPSSKIYNIKTKLDKGIINKYTILLNFERLGFTLRLFFILHPKINYFHDVGILLRSTQNINNLYIIDDHCSYFFEAIFYDTRELANFLASMNKFEFNKKEYLYITEEIKKEGFLL